MKVRTSFTIDERIIEEAKKLAKKEGRTLSNYVNVALAAVNKQKKPSRRILRTEIKQ